jgi:hypothetical protein
MQEKKYSDQKKLLTSFHLMSSSEKTRYGGFLLKPIAMSKQGAWLLVEAYDLHKRGAVEKVEETPWQPTLYTALHNFGIRLSHNGFVAN